MAHTWTVLRVWGKSCCLLSVASHCTASRLVSSRLQLSYDDLLVSLPLDWIGLIAEQNSTVVARCLLATMESPGRQHTNTVFQSKRVAPLTHPTSARTPRPLLLPHSAREASHGNCLHKKQKPALCFLFRFSAPRRKSPRTPGGRPRADTRREAGRPPPCARHNAGRRQGRVGGVHHHRVCRCFPPG